MLVLYGKSWIEERARAELESRRNYGKSAMKSSSCLYNHCRVPYSYPENIPIAHWVARQRKFYASELLPENRKEALDGIGFSWTFEEIYDDAWQQKYEELATHVKEKRWRPLGNNLVQWIRTQRMRKSRGLLEPEREAMLDDIDFDWVEELWTVSENQLSGQNHG